MNNKRKDNNQKLENLINLKSINLKNNSKTFKKLIKKSKIYKGRYFNSSKVILEVIF